MFQKSIDISYDAASCILCVEVPLGMCQKQEKMEEFRRWVKPCKYQLLLLPSTFSNYSKASSKEVCLCNSFRWRIQWPAMKTLIHYKIIQLRIKHWSITLLNSLIVHHSKTESTTSVSLLMWIHRWAHLLELVV